MKSIKRKRRPKPRPKYRQCYLVRDCGSSRAHQVAFLPAKHAHAGNVVRLKINNQWEDGWQVVTAGRLVDDPPDVRKLIRKHRHNTGDDETWTD